MTRLTTLPRAASLEERLSRYTVDENGCWRWSGAIKENGYGCLSLDGRVRYTHRLAYELWVGPVPDGMQLDHLCRNRACMNPAHLEPVTPSVNVRRGESPGAKALRRTHCVQGHAYAEHGVIRMGRRVCRTCRTEYMRRYNADLRALRERIRSERAA